jgi:hypothetical protein
MPELVELLDGVPTIDFRAHGAGASASPEELARGGNEALARYGCLRLLEVFSPAFVEELRRYHDATYGRYAAQLLRGGSGGHRAVQQSLPLDVEGGFARPAFFANPRVYAILLGALGRDFALGHLASALAAPGASERPLTRHATSLFGDAAYDASMPLVRVAMALPLVELDRTTGGFRVALGTHGVANDTSAGSMPASDVFLAPGSCLLLDSRTLHAGVGNRTDRACPVVFATYHRHWFRDRGGFVHEEPLAISEREFARVPGDFKHLFAWRFDRYARQRSKIALRRVVSRLPTPMLKAVYRFLGRQSG